jgi:hypothetical protein
MGNYWLNQENKKEYKMGCGCSGGKSNLSRNSRPTILPRQNTIRSTPITSQNVVQAQALTASGLTADQRSIEKKRREAIFRKLGRI